MTRSARFRLAMAVGTIVGATLLGGCSAGGDGRFTVSKNSLESTAKDNLQAAVGETSQGVECEGGIDGRVGATQRCVLVAEDGSTVDVTATVESVNGETVNIGFNVHDGSAG